jgi:hypothetical protein
MTTGTATGGSGGAGGTGMAGTLATGGGSGAGGSASPSDAGVVGFSRPKGTTPNKAYPASMVNSCNSEASCTATRPNWQKDLVSPTMNDKHHHNQPIVVNGYLLINGNEEFFYWDISDPANPKMISQFNTPNRCDTCGGKGEGEAESQQVSTARYGDSFYEVTTSGYGVDIWNITDPMNVVHLKSIKLDGVNYGDFTSAVWGMYWQGDYIYIGTTDNGLDILDAHDPTNVTWLKDKRMPTSKLGGVIAGPVFAIGNILVVTTPKTFGGIAVLDITDPVNPVTLSSVRPSASYIGGFYRHYAYLQSPVRAWDVLTDPTNIGTATTPVGSINTAGSEYMSFGDGNMYLGHLRPNPGASVINVMDPKKMAFEARVWGRVDNELVEGGEVINDDQFTIQVGNLLVMGDDQAPYRGSIIGVWQAAPDTKPPVLDTVLPKDKATGVSTKSRIGLSFTDNIELATVNPASVIVRPMGGEPISGKWGLYWTVLNFWPDQDLKPNTTYEVLLPKGGLTDLVGNAIADDFTSTFTTGSK